MEVFKEGKDLKVSFKVYTEELFLKNEALSGGIFGLKRNHRKFIYSRIMKSSLNVLNRVLSALWRELSLTSRSLWEYRASWKFPDKINLRSKIAG